jgi:hypothetical protein
MTDSSTDNKDTSKAGLVKAIARWPWPEIVFFVACMISTFTIVSAVTGDYLDVRSRTRVNAVVVDDHEQRIRQIEQQLTRIDANVEWIRTTLEKRSNP